MGSTGAQKVYASVKSHSQRGRLLPKSILQTLAESRDLGELVTRIKNTKYTGGISKITKLYCRKNRVCLAKSSCRHTLFNCKNCSKCCTRCILYQISYLESKTNTKGKNSRQKSE